MGDYQATISFTLTFVHMIWTSIEVIFSLKAFTIPRLATFKQRGQDIFSGQHFLSKTRRLVLTFDHVIWKLIGVTYSLGAFTVPSLEISSKGVKRYWSDTAWSTDRPTGRYKTICPFFQMGAEKYHHSFISLERTNCKPQVKVETQSLHQWKNNRQKLSHLFFFIILPARDMVLVTKYFF